MDANEDILQGLASSVPSVNLDQLLAGYGWNNIAGVNPPVTSTGSFQNNDVVHTSSNLMANTNNETKNPSITVVIENRMVRFRYDSELNNRNYGKEVLAKILVHDFIGKARIRIHAVDDKKFKAHPFCLIGDKCYDGVYIEEHEISADKNECICKATPRIPKQKNYEDELNKRKNVIHDVNRFPFITPDMDKDDYWTTNKNIKESKEIILVVEVICFDQNIESCNSAGYSIQHSEPINNAKDGKKFEVYAIAPVTSSVLGAPHDSHFIILTSDSYSPNECDIEVRFCDDGNWTEKVSGKVIKNAIEFYFPGYHEPLSVEKTIYVYVYDKKRKIQTSKFNLTLRPSDNDIIAHKRKKATKFSLPDGYMDVKKEEPTSCSGGQRQIHRLKRNRPTGSAASSPLDLAKLEEEGLLSLNISSPMNQNENSMSSTSTLPQTASLSDFNNPSATLNGTIPNTIPAILIPSGSRDMQSNPVMFGSQDSQLSQPDVNNIAVTNSSQNIDFLSLNQADSQMTIVPGSSQNNDLSQQQTLSLSELMAAASQDPTVVQEIMKFLQGQSPNLSNSSNFNPSQGNNIAGYDPHDIQLEDLVAIDEFDHNDIEVDCEKISSSTEVKDGCEKCESEQTDKKNDKESDKNVHKTEKKEINNPDSTTASKNDNKKEDSATELQSDIVTSNVDSDIEEG